jgi:hypothetical protein
VLSATLEVSIEGIGQFTPLRTVVSLQLLLDELKKVMLFTFQPWLSSSANSAKSTTKDLFAPHIKRLDVITIHPVEGNDSSAFVESLLAGKQIRRSSACFIFSRALGIWLS